MGGTNSDEINGLRFHVSSNEVHVHEDKSSLKFSVAKGVFVNEVESALKTLKNNDGIIRIDGDTKVSFHIMSYGQKVIVFLADGTSVKTKLKKFVKGV